jgi:hypothetical protein
MSLRPERQAPPEFFYNETEARKYTTSSRIIDIQVLRTFFCCIQSEKRLFSVYGLMGVLSCACLVPQPREQAGAVLCLYTFIFSYMMSFSLVDFSLLTLLELT